MKVNAKKALLVFTTVAAVFALGFAGGIVASRMAAGGGPEEAKAPQAHAYSILPLGEFKMSLTGGKYSDSSLASFELVLELESKKILEKLKADEYWETLFRNEVIAECMSQGAEGFQSSEAVLKLSEAITRRLNAVSPSIDGVEFPIRRVLFKSLILQ
ncbi:MAG: flagellar basal body-associated protein FliL [Thermovirgaceae bacterium]